MLKYKCGDLRNRMGCNRLQNLIYHTDTAPRAYERDTERIQRSTTERGLL